MAILNRIVISFALALLTASCFSPFDPDIDSTPVLCMNSEIRVGEPISVSLTRTWRRDAIVSDPAELDVADAEVQLMVNGVHVETLRPAVSDGGVPDWHPSYEPRTVYAGDYLPKPGDEIRLVALSERYGGASAEVTVPMPVAIDRVECDMTDWYDSPFSWGKVCDVDLKVWLTDPADEVNYYKVEIGATERYSNDDGSVVSAIGYEWFDTSREPLFTEHLSVLEQAGAESSGYTIFSDRQISGKSYPVHIALKGVSCTYRNPDGDPAVLPPGIKITLASISRSYYSHVLSVWVANDGIAGALGSVGLGDIVPAWSNVSTGAGVVAALTPVTATLRF